MRPSSAEGIRRSTARGGSGRRSRSPDLQRKQGKERLDLSKAEDALGTRAARSGHLKEAGRAAGHGRFAGRARSHPAYCAAPPVAAVVFFSARGFSRGFSPKPTPLDHIVILVVLLLLLRYSVRVLAIVRRQPGDAAGQSVERAARPAPPAMSTPSPRASSRS